MLRDRGNIKWTAMMLPEHVHMVKQYIADQNKVAKPTLDEQEWYEIEIAVKEALEFNLSLEFTYWRNGYYEKLTGRIYSHNKTEFRIEDQSGDRFTMKFEDIVKVEINS